MTTARGRGALFRGVGVCRRFAVALAFIGIMTLVAQSAAAATRPLSTGIAALDTYDPVALHQARASGVRLIHIWVNMTEVVARSEPSNWQPNAPADPNYNWTEIDLRVIRVIEGGLTPVLGIYGVPSWAQRCRAENAPLWSPCDPDPVIVADFAHAAAVRYSGYFNGLPRVRYWQGFNEPNLSLYFNPQFEYGRSVSPALYRTLINAFYFAVKSVHRSNLVIAAGLGPIAIPRWTIGPMRFARELLCMTGRHEPRPARGNCGGGVHFDIFDMHPYTTGGPTHRGKVDDVQLGDLAKLKELIGAADHAGRIKGRFRHTPIWITEFSWDSKPPDPGGVPMRILTRWTAEVLHRAWDAGIAHFFWFRLRDSAPDPNVPFSASSESGLYFRGATVAEDRPKPHMYAFRFPFVAYSQKDGFSFWGRTPTSKGGLVRIQIREGGNWRTVTVARADRHGIFEGEVEIAYGRNKRGTVRARYRKEIAIPFSLKPVRDFWQPPFGKPVG